MIAFGLLAIAFDVATRKAYHVRKPWMGTLVRDAADRDEPGRAAGTDLSGHLRAVVQPETSVYRYQVGNTIGTGGPFAWVPGAWRSLWYYESGILEFHAGLTNAAGNHHPWESKPWTWPMSLRPMLYAIENGPDQCGSGECVRAQMLIGSPAMVVARRADAAVGAVAAGDATRLGARRRPRRISRGHPAVVHLDRPADVLLLRHRAGTVPRDGSGPVLR